MIVPFQQDDMPDLEGDVTLLVWRRRRVRTIVQVSVGSVALFVFFLLCTNGQITNLPRSSESHSGLAPGTAGTGDLARPGQPLTKEPESNGGQKLNEVEVAGVDDASRTYIASGRLRLFSRRGTVRVPREC